MSRIILLKQVDKLYLWLYKLLLLGSQTINQNFLDMVANNKVTSELSNSEPETDAVRVAKKSERPNGPKNRSYTATIFNNIIVTIF
jgi:hypothetical protein